MHVVVVMGVEQCLLEYHLEPPPYCSFISIHSQQLNILPTYDLGACTDRNVGIGNTCTFAPDKTQDNSMWLSHWLWMGIHIKVVTRCHYQRCPARRPEQGPPSPPSATVTIPYIWNVSESIRRILTPLNIKTCFKPHQTLGNILVHAKDRTPQESQAGVFYQVSCSDCPATYVGQTGRTIQHNLLLIHVPILIHLCLALFVPGIYCPLM